MPLAPDFAPRHQLSSLEHSQVLEHGGPVELWEQRTQRAGGAGRLSEQIRMRRRVADASALNTRSSPSARGVAGVVSPPDDVEPRGTRTEHRTGVPCPTRNRCSSQQRQRLSGCRHLCGSTSGATKLRTNTGCSSGFGALDRLRSRARRTASGLTGSSSIVTMGSSALGRRASTSGKRRTASGVDVSMCGGPKSTMSPGHAADGRQEEARSLRPLPAQETSSHRCASTPGGHAVEWAAAGANQWCARRQNPGVTMCTPRCAPGVIAACPSP